ncbi:cytidylyltransferase domain-containing protein [Polaribacter marinivivus]|uniref:cytidylyltransferase domain-containing protein n=1 Tax=Polaribacter marinivivus TaxID=1524260 RepID=UPI003D344E1E
MNIAFIPARCGSKSIKFKNIKLFCNKPLIYWNIKALQESSMIDEIVVATDCSKIQKTVEAFDFKKVRIYERDKLNAEDNSSTESVILEFLQRENFNDKDNFILVQATSPLTETKDFEEALIKMKSDNSDSLLTCVRVKRFLWNDSNEPINYNFKKRPRRQDFNGVLIENGAFYINTVSNIISSKNRLSGKISIYEMEDYKYIEIDEDNDWIIAESLMKKHNKKNEALKKIKVFLSDVDGTLTDSGMYYSELGDELKKFNTRDGKGFELLRKAGVKIGIITSEETSIVSKRSNKLKLDYLFQGKEHQGKLNVVLEICKKEGFSLDEIAYIGDDVNCYDLLKNVGIAACPKDSVSKVKEIPNIHIMNKKGGDGCVREFIEFLLTTKKL